MKKECIAMLLAGGQGSRLYVLTGDMAKPAVPFGGKFRIIDFPLSNCTNSGIDTVGVLTQYRPLELNSYIGSGQPWDLDRVRRRRPHPAALPVRHGGTLVQGHRQRHLPEHRASWTCTIRSMCWCSPATTSIRWTIPDMLRRHKAAGAACTISVMEVPWEEASRFGIMSVDEQDRITEFAEKAQGAQEQSGVHGHLYLHLEQAAGVPAADDEADPNTDNDFGKNIIPAMLGGETMAAYRFEGYWKDVGTLDSLWDANMDMLSPGSGLNLLDKKWPIYGRTPTARPRSWGRRATSATAPWPRAAPFWAR